MLDAGGKAIILRDEALRRNNGTASQDGASAPRNAGNIQSHRRQAWRLGRTFESCRDIHVKLHLDRPGATNLITAFDQNAVVVNQSRYTASLIVLADRLIDTWAPRAFDTLSEADFDVLAGLGVDIVLLGTGRTLRFPHPRLSSRLLSRRIGLEAMDTAAACRTYNILSGEGRNVAAALIIE